MKGILSISFVFLILLSGMRFTIATHYCCGKIAASKVSVSGELATCGMEGSEVQRPVQGKYINPHCCANNILVLAVDKNYNPSSFEFKAFTRQIVQVFQIPDDFLIHLLNAVKIVYTNGSPPGILLVSAVSLPDICVFRI